MQIFLLPRDIRLIFDLPPSFSPTPVNFTPGDISLPRHVQLAAQRSVVSLCSAPLLFSPLFFYICATILLLPFPFLDASSKRNLRWPTALAKSTRCLKKKNKMYKDSCDILCNLNFHFHRKNKKIARGKLLIDELVN